MQAPGVEITVTKWTLPSSKSKTARNAINHLFFQSSSPQLLTMFSGGRSLNTLFVECSSLLSTLSDFLTMVSFLCPLYYHYIFSTAPLVSSSNTTQLTQTNLSVVFWSLSLSRNLFRLAVCMNYVHSMIRAYMQAQSLLHLVLARSLSASSIFSLS